MTDVITDRWSLATAIRAFDTVRGLDEDQVRGEYARQTELRQYLDAEIAWKDKIRRWLAAERKWLLSKEKFSSETYAAAKKGWDALKLFVPNQDGVPSFDRLPESLQFRYAAFAAAVLELEPPSEVKSSKQITKEISEHF